MFGRRWSTSCLMLFVFFSPYLDHVYQKGGHVVETWSIPNLLKHQRGKEDREIMEMGGGRGHVGTSLLFRWAYWLFFHSIFFWEFCRRKKCMNHIQKISKLVSQCWLHAQKQTWQPVDQSTQTVSLGQRWGGVGRGGSTPKFKLTNFLVKLATIKYSGLKFFFCGFWFLQLPTSFSHP